MFLCIHVAISVGVAATVCRSGPLIGRLEVEVGLQSGWLMLPVTLTNDVGTFSTLFLSPHDKCGAIDAVPDDAVD